MAYEALVTGSSRELSKLEKLFFTDTEGMVGLNDLDGDTKIPHINGYVQVHVHNDKLKDNTEYDLFIVEAIDEETGEAVYYYTSSDSFASAFLNIYKVMDGEPFGIMVKRIPSRNYKDKFILSCKILM